MGMLTFNLDGKSVSLDALHLAASHPSDKDHACTFRHLARMDQFWHNVSRHLGCRCCINTAGILHHVNPPQERVTRNASTGELECMSIAAMELCLFENALDSLTKEGDNKKLSIKMARYFLNQLLMAFIFWALCCQLGLAKTMMALSIAGCWLIFTLATAVRQTISLLRLSSIHPDTPAPTFLLLL